MSERRSKEKRQEELSKKIGDLLNQSINANIEDLPHTQKRINDYILTIAVETSNGKYITQSNGDIEWENPEKFGTQHIQLIIQDRDDKRFVPYLDVNIKIFDKNNNLIDESEAPFIWHPYVYNYGFDTVFPNDGEYYFEVTIKNPKFDRYNFGHGKKYQDKITTKLGSIEIVLPGEEIEFSE